MLKGSLEKISGLRYVVESLELCSSLARQRVLEARFCSDARKLNDIFDNIESAKKLLNEDQMIILRLKLSQIRDIRVTVKSLAGRHELFDPEFFEIKHFSLLATEIAELTKSMELSFVRIPELTEVTKKLDPDGTGSATFYVYDSYSAELAAARKKNRITKNEDTYIYIDELEKVVRGELVDRLHPFAHDLATAIEAVAELDITIAKAMLAERWSLTRPIITDTKTEYRMLKNPQVKAVVEGNKGRFQAVDILLADAPVLITGANMAGKTVLLKSLAVAGAMCQYGFFVPAEYAEVKPVDEIVLIIGDEQDETKGLSSFAAEMLRISDAVAKIRSGKRLLLLVDEPARTTNPVEGTAIVDAIIDILIEHRTMSVITTHYGELNARCKRLKVKGFSAQNDEKITKENINRHIDYSMTEVTGNDVPHEALRIAEILNVDKEIINKAKEYAKK